MSSLLQPFGNSTAPKTGYKSVNVSDSAFPDLEESSDPFTDVSEATSTDIQLYHFNATAAQPQLMIYTSLLDTAKLRATIRRNALVIVDKKVNNWWSVHCCGFSGWTYMADMLSNMESVEAVRRHEDWRGNNYFFLNGKIMVGSDGKLFLFTNALILVPSFIFFKYTLPSLASYFSPYNNSGDHNNNNHYYSYIIAVTFMYSVAIFMYYHLWCTAILDPGILPRQPKHAKPNPPPPLIQAMQLKTNDNGEVDSMELVGWKWCSTCNIYRPPRYAPPLLVSSVYPLFFFLLLYISLLPTMHCSNTTIPSPSIYPLEQSIVKPVRIVCCSSITIAHGQEDVLDYVITNISSSSYSLVVCTVYLYCLYPYWY